ncbi:hypothetical protein [Armatimonas rosea]|uniref:Uncharacterized protein n=1 Tax=Armatimonas rosea TaxID=685828 RepID=A0A7W9SWK6_ARMRO|nr:hypothetical protein [Armatimonas rosea]MBB6053308.1 hypothetical protein [Armatimonas rosea]
MSRLPAISPSTQRQVAELVAARLARYAQGFPLASRATWERVAEEMGVSVHLYHVPGAGRGEWRASPPDGDPSAIAINTAYPEIEVAKAFVHELAELLLHRLQPPLLDDGSDAGRYEGEPADERHKVARRVERILLG